MSGYYENTIKRCEPLVGYGGTFRFKEENMKRYLKSDKTKVLWHKKQIKKHEDFLKKHEPIKPLKSRRSSKRSK